MPGRPPAHLPAVGFKPGGFLEDRDQLLPCGRRRVEITGERDRLEWWLRIALHDPVACCDLNSRNDRLGNVRCWQILLQKSKTERLQKSRESRFSSDSNAAKRRGTLRSDMVPHVATCNTRQRL